jgi:regulator of protease activity HflC (stomatin/prohibitin superfamily)
MRDYLYLILGLATMVVGWGILGPQLVSMQSDIGVYAGITVAVAGVPFLLYNIWKMWREDPDTDSTVATIRSWLNIRGPLPVVLLAFIIVGCSKVPAGNVGVKVYLLGGEKGVDNEVLTPGRYWIGINEELFLFPTFTQNYVWTADADESSPTDESISFQTREGLTVSADVGISYSVRADKVSTIFEKYRRGIEEITDVYLRNMVRDAMVTVASSLPIEAVYGQGKADMIQQVENIVRGQVDPIGISVERIYWIGDARLPEVVTTSINNKIEATQKAQQRRNEIEERKAEAQKTIETARGAAESQKLTADARAYTVLKEAEAQARPTEYWPSRSRPSSFSTRASNAGTGPSPGSWAATHPSRSSSFRRTSPSSQVRREAAARPRVGLLTTMVCIVFWKFLLQRGLLLQSSQAQ